ncbi:hypothetical protein AB0O34_36110, partial [Sphaerisporangium sp. NPDC088356]
MTAPREAGAAGRLMATVREPVARDVPATARDMASGVRAVLPARMGPVTATLVADVRSSVTTVALARSTAKAAVVRAAAVRPIVTTVAVVRR